MGRFGVGVLVALALGAAAGVEAQGPGGRGGAGGQGAMMMTADLGRVLAQELTSPHRVRYDEITMAAQREALLPLLRRPPGDR